MSIGELMDKIPVVVKALLCVPALLTAWLVGMVWIGLLAGIIRPERLDGDK